MKAEPEATTATATEPEPEPKPDAAAKAEPEEAGTAAVLAAFSPYARIDQLPLAEAVRLCEIDRAERERKADVHQKAGLGCKLAAATFARTRQACRGFYRNCMARNPSRPKSENLCEKLNPAACTITVAEFAACREAEQLMIQELLVKLDCDYQGPRLTTPPTLAQCEKPKQRCAALFEYPNRPAPRKNKRGESR